MISYCKLGSAGGAAKYLTAERTDARAEYYAKENVYSTWSGNGADLAGMTPGKEVETGDLVRVLEGRLHNPATGELQALGRPKDGTLEHRPGLDLTFSAPKSVSIVGLIGGDERVFAAHEAAVEKAMMHLEGQASTRVRLENSSIEYRTTGNLLYAKFQHETSRAMDPQMHTHVAVANATYDQASEKWRSLEYNSLVRDLKTADAIYKNELASHLQELGYETRWTKNGPEIEGINREQIEQFSKRTAAIDKALEEQGINREEASAAMRSSVALETRDKKQHIDRDTLNARWRTEAHSVGLDIDRVVHQAQEHAQERRPQSDRALDANAAVDKAIRHLAEREQAFSRSDMIREANEFSRGQASAEQLDQAISRAEKAGALIDRGTDVDSGKAMYTTPAAIRAEQEQIAQIRAGIGAVPSIMSPSEAGKALDQADAGRAFPLDAGQREAAQLILTTEDRIVGVQGYAGAGKTTMLDTVKQMAESKGYAVVGMANGAEQASKLQKESGIESQTVARFLAQTRGDGASTAAAGQPQLWIVDEASQLSQKDWNSLQTLAADKGARVVFVGDKDQHQSVGAGCAFENAQASGQMKTATLTEIYRQKDEPGKAAVQDLIHGRYGEAFDRVTAVPGQGVEVRSAVQDLEAKYAGKSQAEIPPHELKAARELDSKALVDKTARLYLEQPNPTESTLIFTATNQSRIEINQAVREQMKASGQLTGPEIQVTSLTDLKLTDAQKAEAWRYEPGMVVQADRAYRGLKVDRGDQFRVLGHNEKTNTVQLQDVRTGREMVVNPERRTGFTPYAAHTVGMSAGDAIRFTKNGVVEGVNNGTRGKVVHVSDKEITVNADGRDIKISPESALHLQHRYASTTYKDQGNQATKGIYVIDTNRAGGVGSRDAYVGMTRAERGTVIVTDDMHRARQLVQREQGATTALDAGDNKKQATEQQQAMAKEIKQEIKQVAKQEQKMQITLGR